MLSYREVTADFYDKNIAKYVNSIKLKFIREEGKYDFVIRTIYEGELDVSHIQSGDRHNVHIGTDACSDKVISELEELIGENDLRMAA
tara:strand:- start:991 stop:1254 length:264 start_codon:yes stop_codon:yes gene_type:complete